MRLLLDNNLSPRLVELLTLGGWNVAHVRALGLQAARNDHRVLVSAGTDFGALFGASDDPGPSIVLVRRVVGRRVEELAGILIATPPGRGGPPAGQHRRDRGRHAPDPPPAHRLTRRLEP